MYDKTINNDPTMSGGDGTLLASRYRVIRPLGQGGMGSVWLAEDTQLDNRQVAIKMLPSVLVSNKRAYQQLKAEALVSLKLPHPNIATVRAFEENNGNPFLVVDYIDGLTLDEYLGRKGKLTEEATASILLPVAEALDYAHERGVVHRDVKPGNIMVTRDGVPYVLDFGIAREMQETMTRVTGRLSSGTLLYMSPEQLRGASPKAAQDVYSFAALAYECLTGHPPFSRGQVEYQILNEPPEPLPDDVVMGRRVMMGLAKDPKCRPDNCRAIMADWQPMSDWPGGGAESYFSPSTQGQKDLGPDDATKPLPPDKIKEQPATVAKGRVWLALAFVGVALTALLVAFVVRARRPHSTPQAIVPAEAEKPVGLDDAYVDVGVLVGRIERIDREDGFGAKIDQVLDAYRRAQKHFDVRQWKTAERLFAEVRRDAENVQSEDAARKKAKRPSLLLVAKVDGREVRGAKVTIGDRTYVTPADLGDVSAYGTQGPFSVSYTENYRLYEGRFQSIPVDWQGARKLSFSLKEHVFPKAGARKVVTLPSGGKMAFRWCPAGEFMMGSPINEAGRFGNEQQHLVKLPTGFWMSETEVTQGQWKNLMEGATIHTQARKALADDLSYMLSGRRQTYRAFWKKNIGDDVTDRCGDLCDDVPIYYVSWFDAEEFCRRLTDRERSTGRLPEGLVYRLPTEAEWEYACRAGVSTTLPNGKGMSIRGERDAPELDDIAWYGGNSCVDFVGRGRPTSEWKEKQYSGDRAAPRVVAKKKANEWGIYDVLGNVGEWCGDWYSVNASGETDPLGPRTGARRVVRGGAWVGEARNVRPACRVSVSPGVRFDTIGFRVALAPIRADWPFDASNVGDAVRLPEPAAPEERSERREAPEQKAEEPNPVPSKPTVRLSTTLNGVPVPANVVEGLIETHRKTPQTVTLHNPVGTDWNYAVEYFTGEKTYRTEGTFRVRPGQHKVTLRLEDGKPRPPDLNFCHQCREPLSGYATIGEYCPFCHKNLFKN